MWLNPRKTVDLVTFTEEIFNGKLYFLYREGVTYSQEPIRRIMTFKYEKLLLLKSPIKDGAKYCDHWKKKKNKFIYTKDMKVTDLKQLLILQTNQWFDAMFQLWKILHWMMVRRMIERFFWFFSSSFIL